MHWSIDISIIRSLFGDAAGDFTDSDLSSDGIIIPILQMIRQRCPGILESTDHSTQEIVKIVVARLVVAHFLSVSPRVASSRLGDSTIGIAAGSTDDQVNAWRSSAWELLATICPGSGISTTAFFTLAQGGRR